VTVLLDPRTGEVVRRLKINDSVVKDLSFSLDGRALMVASAGKLQQIFGVPGGEVRWSLGDVAIRRSIWMKQAGLLLAPYAMELLQIREEPLTLPSVGMQDLEVNLEGTRAVGLGGDNALWVGDDGDPPLWHSVMSLPDSTGTTIAGDDVFASTEKEILRFDTGDRITWRAPIPSGVSDLSASPDGRWLALGIKDGGILVYRVGESAPRARMNAHHARLSSLAFSPDSQWLASGGWDNAVRLWSVSAFDADSEVTAATVEAAWGRRLEEVLERL
jgi:hypothetical protein